MFTSLDLDWSLRSSKKMSAPSRHEIDLFHQLLSNYIGNCETRDARSQT